MKYVMYVLLVLTLNTPLPLHASQAAAKPEEKKSEQHQAPVYDRDDARKFFQEAKSCVSEHWKQQFRNTPFAPAPRPQPSQSNPLNDTGDALIAVGIFAKILGWVKGE